VVGKSVGSLFFWFGLVTGAFLTQPLGGNLTPVESEIRVRNDVDAVYAEPGLRRTGGVLAPAGPDVGSPVQFPNRSGPIGA
jgi:hypothetical protein